MGSTLTKFRKTTGFSQDRGLAKREKGSASMNDLAAKTFHNHTIESSDE